MGNLLPADDLSFELKVFRGRIGFSSSLYFDETPLGTFVAKPLLPFCSTLCPPNLGPNLGDVLGDTGAADDL